MFLTNFLRWLDATHFSQWMRGSILAEPIVESTHVLTLTLFLGFAVLLDLRLLGVVMRKRPVSEVLDQFNPYLMWGFAVMIVSGVLLFSGDPLSFYSTIFFKIKMILLVFAGLNVLIFNATIRKKVAEWDLAAKTPRAAKIAAVVSLLLWVAIVAAGRAIAYALPPP
ncbi:MAG: hypothetical protein KGL02_06090 [Acidobacteriota bacterium]|nr:hypothetical protein [Acidobacteriota bacterium]MDE3169290.1 hypothetical protein [Acidobacteriota bacterium]